MTIVTLTRTASGFVNISPSWQVGAWGDPEADANVSQIDYKLPDGFEVAECSDTSLQIYAGTHHCEIITHSSGRPQLVYGDPHHMPVLERA